MPMDILLIITISHIYFFKLHYGSHCIMTLIELLRHTARIVTHIELLRHTVLWLILHFTTTLHCDSHYIIELNFIVITLHFNATLQFDSNYVMTNNVIAKNRWSSLKANIMVFSDVYVYPWDVAFIIFNFSGLIITSSLKICSFW